MLPVMPLPSVLLLTLGALLPSALALGSPALQEQPSAPAPVTATDLANLRQVANLELSPDGSAAIAEVTRLVGDVLDRAGSARYVRELWRFDLDRPGEARQLTFGERAAGQPAISPDGRWLAFIRAGVALPGAKPGEGDDTSGVDLPQVWLLPLDGPGEARQLTRFEFGADRPRWFPDSQALLVSSSWPAERIEVPAPFLKPGAAPLEQARALQPRPKAESKSDATMPADASGWADWLLAGENDADPRRIDRRNFQGEQSLAGPLEVERLSEVRLSGALGREWKSGWLSLESAALSPDGNALVFCSSYPLDVAPDHSEYHALFLWRLSAPEPELLLADERWDLGEPHWSDDGARLFFTLQPTNEPTFGQTRLGTMELSNGAFALLAEDIDAQLAAPAYGGGGLLFFLREREGRTTLMGLDLETRQHRPLVDAAGSVQRFASRAGRIVYALSTASNPCEIYAFDAAEEDPRLSDLHSTWLKQ
jgi:dipeptidyl aminopeptidase/acylaminoacyl peptidase